MNIDYSEAEGGISVIMREACLLGIEAKYAGIWYLLISASLLEREVAGFGPEFHMCGVFKCVPWGHARNSKRLYYIYYVE